MSKIKIQPNLIDEIKDYGGFDVSACFNCGTCTATCPLIAEEINEFPRGVIRMAQLGQKDKILGSKELWMCYYCGDCTDQCPRSADPAAFMMAARRYAVANYDPTGLSKLLLKSKLAMLLFIAVLSTLFTLAMRYAASENIFGDHDVAMFGEFYYEAIHYGGIAFGVIMAISFVFSTYRMYKTLAKNEPLRERDYINDEISRGAGIKLAIKALFNTGISEVIKQERFNRDDDQAPDVKPSRWLIHMSIVWGFIGLALATGLNYIVKDIMLGNPFGYVKWYHPIRLLGIISGLVLMFGTTMSIIFKITKPTAYYKDTKFEDWLIILLIWLVGVTGFLTTVMVYLPTEPAWAHWVLVAHVVPVAIMFILIPLTKFAHIVYRPVALWMLKYEELKIEYLEELEKIEKQKAKEAKAAMKATA